MYTMNSTINQILENEFVKSHLSFFMPDFMIDIVSAHDRNIPISILPTKYAMSWGMPYPADTVVFSANLIMNVKEDEKCRFIPLWSLDEPKDYFPDVNNKKTDVSLFIREREDEQIRPLAIVVPGGGYEDVSMPNEGLGTAFRLEEMGYCAVVLCYRTKPNYYPEPQKDLALAIKYMRANADRYHVNPDDVLVLGYSAGGHLSASETLYAKEIESALMRDLKKDFPVLAQKYDGISAKADKVALGYPVISFMDELHEGSFLALTNGDETLRDLLSVELHVDSTYPKTFVWTCDDDGFVPPSNAKRMAEALDKAGVEHKFMLYPTGDHGCALGQGMSAEGWIDEMAEFMK